MTRTSLTITNGLTLNRTAQLDGSQSRLDFSGTQTLAGTGTVVFGDAWRNALRVVTAGDTLTIGPNITVRGGSDSGAHVGYASYFGGIGLYGGARC